jgi:hypothetical protein
MIRNPIILVFLVLSMVSMTKMVYQTKNNNQSERIQRICATLPQPHPDCP